MYYGQIFFFQFLIKKLKKIVYFVIDTITNIPIMCGKNCLLIVAIILIIVAIPLSITSFVFERNENTKECNLNNVMGYDLNKYLFGINISGIVGIIAIVVLLFFLIYLKDIPIIGKLITIILVVIIGIIWIIVALYILFNHRSSCLKVGLTYFGYSGVLITLAIITFFAIK